MNWAKGFISKFYVTIVDRKTLRDLDRVDITGGSINRTDSGLMDSATLNFVDFDQSREWWIRVWMEARQNDTAWKGALFTGLTSSPDRNVNGRLITNSVQCFSVLKAAEDMLLPVGWYLRAGSDGVTEVEKLLEVCGVPIHIESEERPTLKEELIASVEDTRLDMVQYILDAIEWFIRLDGMGDIHLIPVKDEGDISALISSQFNDIMELQFSENRDWYSCPNVFRAINDDMMATVKDEDPNSPFSIENRGREIWMQDTSCYLNANETLAQYAQRRLNEEQTIALVLDYKRRFSPDLFVGDHVYIRYPEQNIEGEFIIESQSIDLTPGAPVSEGAFQF